MENLCELISQAKKYRQEHYFNPLEDINVFSILKMESKEVSAHSALLYYILKPFSTKDGAVDDSNLRLFLKNLGFNKNYGYVDIEREVVTDFGRLDFLILMDEDILVIELKIWANEQYEQISRYQNYLQSQKADIGNILFLTPNERKATTGEARNITLEKHVKNTLEEIVVIRKKNVAYCSTIQQYIEVIKKLVGKQMKNNMDILKSIEDVLAIDELLKARQQLLQGLFQEFFSQIKNLMTKKIQEGAFDLKNGCKITTADYEYGEKAIETYYSAGKKVWPALAYEIIDFKIRGLKNIPENAKLYFFIEAENNFYAGLTLRISNGTDGEIAKFEKDSFQQLKNSAELDIGTPEFLGWEYIKIDAQGINFKNTNNSDFWLKKLCVKDTLKFDAKKLEQVTLCIQRIYVNLCQKFLEE